MILFFIPHSKSQISNPISMLFSKDGLIDETFTGILINYVKRHHVILGFHQGNKPFSYFIPILQVAG